MKTIVISPNNHDGIEVLEKLKASKAIAKAKAEERLIRKATILKNTQAKQLNG
jgi:hypothetical protein